MHTCRGQYCGDIACTVQVKSDVCIQPKMTAVSSGVCAAISSKRWCSIARSQGSAAVAFHAAMERRSASVLALGVGVMGGGRRASMDGGEGGVGGAVERGEVNLSIDNIHRLAVALDVPATDLLTGP